MATTASHVATVTDRLAGKDDTGAEGTDVDEVRAGTVIQLFLTHNSSDYYGRADLVVNRCARNACLDLVGAQRHHSGRITFQIATRVAHNLMHVLKCQQLMPSNSGESLDDGARGRNSAHEQPSGRRGIREGGLRHSKEVPPPPQHRRDRIRATGIGGRQGCRIDDREDRFPPKDRERVVQVFTKELAVHAVPTEQQRQHRRTAYPDTGQLGEYFGSELSALGRTEAGSRMCHVVDNVGVETMPEHADGASND